MGGLILGIEHWSISLSIVLKELFLYVLLIAFDLVKDAITLSNLFDEIITWVGPANMVHLVTNNAANYVVVGRILCAKYRNIS